MQLTANVYLSKFTLTDDRVATGYWLSHFGEGLKKHGIKVNYVSVHSPPMQGELGVLWNTRDKLLYDWYIKHKIPVVIIERGFTPNRSKWAMAGFNNLNGLAEFCNQSMPSDRWEKYHAYKIKPWSLRGHYVLVLGQMPGDSALFGCDIEQWAKDTMLYFTQRHIPVVYRPHPGPSVTWLDRADDLIEQISNAFCVVTYSSSAGVEAIMQGKPTISCHPGSMVWGVTTHTLPSWEYQHIPDRTQWGYDFAYTQWTSKEMLEGECWDHLKQFLEVQYA